MPARASTTAYATAMDAAIPRDTVPLQMGDIPDWDRVRQLLLDALDTVFAEGAAGWAKNVSPSGRMPLERAYDETLVESGWTDNVLTLTRADGSAVSHTLVSVDSIGDALGDLVGAVFDKTSIYSANPGWTRNAFGATTLSVPASGTARLTFAAPGGTHYRLLNYAALHALTASTHLGGVPTAGTNALSYVVGNQTYYLGINAAGNLLYASTQTGIATTLTVETLSVPSTGGTASSVAAGDGIAVAVNGNVYTVSVADIPLADLPEVLHILASDYSSGGLRQLTDGSIQIAGDLQGSALGVIDTGVTWGSRLERSTGTSPGANPWIQMRFRISDYTALPAVSALEDIVLSPEPSGDPDAPEPHGTVMAITPRSAPTDDTSGLYHYAYVQVGIANWPASTEIWLRRDQPAAWTFPVAPSQLTGGVDGDYMRRIGGTAAWGSAPSGGGTAASLDSTARASSLTLALPATGTGAGSASDKAAAWSAWTDIVSHTVATAGFYTLEGELDVSSDFPHGGGGRYFSETRLVRTRGSVTTTLAERHDYHRNFDTGSDPDHWVLVALDEAEAQDEYKLMVRVRRQATAGASTLNTAAHNTVWTTGCKLTAMLDGGGGAASGQQQLGQLITQFRLTPNSVGVEHLTRTARAELDPEYGVRFASGWGDVLWAFNSPAAGDSVENDNPESSYEPLDPGSQVLPLRYNRSGQTTHTGRLGWVFSFANDTERTADPRYGTGGVVDNALPMALPGLTTGESLLFVGEYISRNGNSSRPIFFIPTNALGTTGIGMWAHGQSGRVHWANEAGVEYGSITPGAGAGADGQLVTWAYQIRKTASGYEHAAQVNGAAVTMSNAGLGNPALARIVYGHFSGTRFNGQMLALQALHAEGRALGIPAGITAGGQTLVSPFTIAISQYSAGPVPLKYTRRWSANLIDGDVSLVNSNEPHIPLNMSFDMEDYSEIRLDLQYYASERASVHSYLSGLTTRTAAAVSAVLVGTWAFEWERGKSPTQYYRGALSNLTGAQYAAYVYPIVNGTIVSELSVRNFANNGDTLTVTGVYVR